MNAGFDDDELECTAVDFEPDKQSNDPPPEFNGTKPSEFKSYRKNVKLWLLFTSTPAQLQGPRVLSRLTGPAWDACDGLEPEDLPQCHAHPSRQTPTEQIQGVGARLRSINTTHPDPGSFHQALVRFLCGRYATRGPV